MLTGVNISLIITLGTKALLLPFTVQTKTQPATHVRARICMKVIQDSSKVITYFEEK